MKRHTAIVEFGNFDPQEFVDPLVSIYHAIDGATCPEETQYRRPTKKLKRNPLPW